MMCALTHTNFMAILFTSIYDASFHRNEKLFIKKGVHAGAAKMLHCLMNGANYASQMGDATLIFTASHSTISTEGRFILSSAEFIKFSVQK